MAQHGVTQRTAAERILEALRWYPDCSLEELTDICPDLMWNQMFLAVDQLSRTGQVILQLRARGLYTVRVPRQKVEVERNP